MIKVYNPANITEANIIGGMLAAHDIEVYIGGQYLQGGVGDLSPLDLASVNVPDQQAEQARALIADYEADRMDADPGVENPQPQSEQPLWHEPVIILLIMFGILGLYLLFGDV